MAKNRDPRVDAFVATAAPFARPILAHLRKLVHQACPGVEESLKWSMPVFLWQEKILCNMAAFKAHCAFGFWHKDMEKALGATHAAKSTEAMGSLGRITSLADLPPDKVMLGYLRRAMELAESGVPGRAKPEKKRPEAKVPADLAAALKKSKKAGATFAELSPSHRREYIEWITGAKRDETRAKRLATTLKWLGEGKSMNWKYQNC